MELKDLIEIAGFVLLVLGYFLDRSRIVAQMSLDLIDPLDKRIKTLESALKRARGLLSEYIKGTGLLIDELSGRGIGVPWSPPGLTDEDMEELGIDIQTQPIAKPQKKQTGGLSRRQR